MSGHVPWHVVSVQPLDDFRLHVRFADGTAGEVDVSRLINGPAAGVFQRLRDRDEFRAVRVEHGAVTWPGDIDLAPDAMYDDIRASGRCVIEPG